MNDAIEALLALFSSDEEERRWDFFLPVTVFSGGESSEPEGQLSSPEGEVFPELWRKSLPEALGNLEIPEGVFSPAGVLTAGGKAGFSGGLYPMSSPAGHIFAAEGDEPAPPVTVYDLDREVRRDSRRYDTWSWE